MATQSDPVVLPIDARYLGDVPANHEVAGEAPAEIGSIAYTQTRVLRPNPALLQENRIVAGLGSGPVAEAYKIMCVQTLQRLREIDGNALAVVSPGNGEGKTLTAINLALSLAREVDQTVLLVDADLRNPSVHKYFGFTPEHGLSDHLAAGVPIDRILVNPGVERFVVLPGGAPLENSVEMLGSQRMARLVQELKARYPSRIVVFDLPPILSVADTIAFAPYVDAAIMVVQENATRRDDIQRAAAMLSSVRLIGTVLNQSNGMAGGNKPAATSLWIRLFGRGR